MDKRVSPPKQVTSPSWGPPPPCNQAVSNDDGNGKRERQKRNRLNRNKNNFARASRFFVHCTLTTTWKCLISCFVEDVNIRQRLSFPFPELLCHFLEFTSSERDGISAIKFDAARIHFLVTFSSLLLLCCLSSPISWRRPFTRLTNTRVIMQTMNNDQRFNIYLD